MASRVRQLIDRAVSPYLADLKQQLLGAQVAIDNLHRDLGHVHAELEQANQRAARAEEQAQRAAGIGRAIYDEEVANRRRLWALRAAEDYELAFSEAEPLVSFLVPTYNSFESLRDVALPSILEQSYRNLEVIVVGDEAPPQTAQAIEEIGDPRVSYFNRTVRGPYPHDSASRWFVIGSAPLADAVARARGRWIATLGDDDAVRPGHTASLLAAAQEHRYEHCYGQQLINFAEGEPMTVGKFPPELGEWGLQAALYHAGLRFFEPELTDAIYAEPNDWSICRRMLRAGVRTGMIDEIVVDKHESRRPNSEVWKHGAVPQVD